MQTARPIVEPMTKMGRPIELPGPLGELAEVVGGVHRLSEEIGVTPRTIHRWGRGVFPPSRPARLALAALARAHGIEPPFETGEQCRRPPWLASGEDR